MKIFMAYSHVAVFSMCSILGGNAVAANGDHNRDTSTEEFQILRHEQIHFHQTTLAPSED